MFPGVVTLERFYFISTLSLYYYVAGTFIIETENYSSGDEIVIDGGEDINISKRNNGKKESFHKENHRDSEKTSHFSNGITLHSTFWFN